MVHKLNQPEFEPVYQLDQSLDVILGYDYLQVDVQTTSQQFPKDDLHGAVRQVADEALASNREVEVAHARELRATVKHDLGSNKAIETASHVEEIKERYREGDQEILELEKVPENLLSTVLSEATTDEREVITGIVKRKIEAVKARQQGTAEELKGIRAGIEHVKAVIDRPLISKPRPIEALDIPEPEPFIADPTIRLFNQINNMLRGIKSGMMHESDLVRALYSELYNSDRPSAYRQFDEMYQSFATIGTHLWNSLSGGFLQKGILYKANKAGRPIEGRPDIVYRAVWGDQEAIIKGKGGIEQRLTIDDIPHVIKWDCVVPARKGQKMTSLDIETLDIAVFTSELVQQKLHEITELEVDQARLAHISSAIIKRAAAEAYRQQLNGLCSELGELAIGIPLNQVEADTNELRAVARRPIIEAEATAASVTEYGNRLATLLPFASEKINERAAEVAASVKPSSGLEELSDEDKRRLEKLEAIEAVLETRIVSSEATNYLLSYFYEHEGDDYQESLAYFKNHNKPVDLKELQRQMRAIDPRDRLMEYFTSFANYPIEMTVLADTVYLHDDRDRSKKHTIMAITTNPKQTSGKTTHRDLAKKGLVLQHGWLEPSTSSTKAAKRKRVLRSLPAKDYSESEFVGVATDGDERYEWESVDEEYLNDARKVAL